jgi:hypothetical protein
MAKKKEKPVTIDGKQLICKFCGYAMFREREAQLHSFWRTFFDFEWLGPSASCYICGSCGYVHWFLREHKSPTHVDTNCY